MALLVESLLHIWPEFTKYVTRHLQAQAQASIFKDAKCVTLVGRIPRCGNGPRSVHVGQAGKCDRTIAIDAACDDRAHHCMAQTPPKWGVRHPKVTGIFFMKRRYPHLDSFSNNELPVLGTEALGDALPRATPLVGKIARCVERRARDSFEYGLRTENPAEKDMPPVRPRGWLERCGRIDRRRGGYCGLATTCGIARELLCGSDAHSEAAE